MCKHPRSSARSRAAGFTLIELFFGATILAIGVAVLVNHLSANYNSTTAQKDRVFAYAKAQAMLAEIQAYVDRGAVSAAIGLDKLDDGVINKPELTITEESGALVKPDHPISGNITRYGRWLWWRRITVQPFLGLNNANVRYVTVRIYKREKDGDDRQVASLSSVVNSVGSAYPTSQVFDVYLLAIENIPGWWVYMEAIVPFVESAITDLENRNPGLKLRTHWITKASYGRNPVYRPYVNVSGESVSQVDHVYYYPGKMPTGNASTYYYVPDLMKGRGLFDGVERHGYDVDTNPFPYSFADFYNHGMRYPQEKALHDLRVGAVRTRKSEIAAARVAGTTIPPDMDDMSEEPTLRLLFEDLCTSPEKYRNALIINLHGELLPMPAIRNYSDAAKAPENDRVRGMRVVTHPEELRTKRDTSAADTDDVVLRVHAYYNDPFKNAPPYKAGADWFMHDNHPIAVHVMGVDLTDGTPDNGLMPGCTIHAIDGGIDIGSGIEPYTYDELDLVSKTTTSVAGMEYKVSFVDVAGQEKYTEFLLYNTPVCARRSSLGEGLDESNWRRSWLYGHEYVPSVTGSASLAGEPLFEDESLRSTAAGPKNTARWIIRIGKDALTTNRFEDATGLRFNPPDDVRLAVKTFIWDDSAAGTAGTARQAGTMFPAMVQPENMSETYTWWADSVEDVPFSERSQFLGDPRHNPYRDLMRGSADFPNGYNWFHDSLNNDGENATLDYNGLDTAVLENGWDGRMREDVPRLMELLRTGLVRSGAVWTTLTGFSYYYLGIGNEIGYDSANGYPNSIPCSSGPWYWDPTLWLYVNNITNSRNYVRNGDGTHWWGMPWLGELYPDHVWQTEWMSETVAGKPDGNLPTGSWSADRFFRYQDNATYWGSAYTTYGTRLYPMAARTSTKGCTTFFNIDNNPGLFGHFFDTGTGSLVGGGLDIASNYNFPIPGSAPINRPWALDYDFAQPPEFGKDPYAGNRNTAYLVSPFYDHPSGSLGSGMLALVDKDDTSAAFITVNGISNTVASGSAFIAKWSLLTMVHSFFETGDKSLAHRIKMPARVEIESPTEITELKDPTSVPIQFDISWTRWDGKPYTTSTPSTFTESESEIEYAVMYSRDNGVSWQYVQDSALAEAGTPPTNPLHIVTDKGLGAETVTWSTPKTNFPEGSYLVRVEAYRLGQSLHYSQHQVKIFIARQV
ncbi:MAG: prepilin-type N-terminal cleavage/methylation domain-containing protein [Planctomycetota bacterium]